MQSTDLYTAVAASWVLSTADNCPALTVCSDLPYTNVSLCSKAICSTWLTFHNPCSNKGANKFPPLFRYNKSQQLLNTNNGSMLCGLRCNTAKFSELRATQAGKGSTLVSAVRKKPRQKTCWLRSVCSSSSSRGGGISMYFTFTLPTW